MVKRDTILILVIVALSAALFYMMCLKKEKHERHEKYEGQDIGGTGVADPTEYQDYAGDYLGDSDVQYIDLTADHAIPPYGDISESAGYGIGEGLIGFGRHSSSFFA